MTFVREKGLNSLTKTKKYKFPDHTNILAQRKQHSLGNKAKGWISKRVFQENKARQIFQKTNIPYP